MEETEIQSPKKDPREIAEIMQRLTRQRVHAFFQTTGISLLSIAIFGSIGYALDLYFKTKPALLFTAIGVSFICTQIILVKFYKKVIPHNK